MEILFIIYTVSLLIIILFFVNMYIQKFIKKNKLEENLYYGNEPLKYIPKKIFQTISDKNKINPAFKKNIEYIKRLNPDWEYKLFDDKEVIDYILSNYGEEYLDIYNMINPKYGPAKADFFRYLLMYREGGAYFDIKSAMSYPLNNIIYPDDKYILSHWECPCHKGDLRNVEGEFCQWYIICSPKHPFLKAVIDIVKENIKTYRISDGVCKNGVLKVTGPIAYSEAIIPILNDYPHRLVSYYEYIGLIYNNLENNMSHKNVFSKTHYTKIFEPIIINARQK